MPFSDNTPILEMLGGGWWRLAQPGGLVYTTNAGLEILVPEGFVTDLASVPRGFWNLLPPAGDYAPAAVVHDYLYRNQQVAGTALSRGEADGIMLEAMDALGVGWLSRYMIWIALRAAGGVAWDECTRALAPVQGVEK